MSINLKRDDAIAAGITAPIIGAYFFLPVALWFALTVLIVGAIAVKTGLR